MNYRPLMKKARASFAISPPPAPCRNCPRLRRFALSPTTSCPGLTQIDLSDCGALETVLVQSNSVEKLTLTACGKLTKLLVQAKARRLRPWDQTARCLLRSASSSPAAAARIVLSGPRVKTHNHLHSLTAAGPKAAGAPRLREPQHDRGVERRAHGPGPRGLPLAPVRGPLLPAASRGIHRGRAGGACEDGPVPEVSAARESAEVAVQERGARNGEAAAARRLWSSMDGSLQLCLLTRRSARLLLLPLLLPQARKGERDSERSISISDYYSPRVFHSY